MRNLSKSVALGFVLALLCIPPLHAQTAARAQADTNTTAANPAAAGQAPEEVMKRLSDLVHAGKYAEAQQLTTGLLTAYPNDQRLIKVKALLDKSLASAGSAKQDAASNPSSNNSVPAQRAANPHAELLTGMDKVDYTALIELVRQAQQTTDLPQQTKLLQQFMDQSALFLQKHPEQMLLWQLRAVSAISLNAPLEGFNAAQKLLAAGASESNDPQLSQLLTKLKLLGWMNKQQAEERQLSADNERKRQAEAAKTEQLRAEHDKYTFPVAHAHAFGYGYGHMTINENDAEYVASDETIRFAKNDIREMKVLCVAKNMCGFYFYPKDGRKLFFLAVTEDAIANRSLEGRVFLPPSVLGDAAVARWKFVSIDNKTLGPPPAAQNSAPMNNPSSQPAATVLQKSAPPVNDPAPLAPGPASEPPAHNVAFVNNLAPASAEPAAHNSAPADTRAPLAAAQNTTILHVYRPHRLIAAVQKPYVYVDGKKITPIANSQEIRMLLTPGTHTISVSKKSVENELPINDLVMAAGNEYWIRVDISAGAWAAHSKLYVVPAGQAQSESKGMEEIRIGDVSMN